MFVYGSWALEGIGDKVLKSAQKILPLFFSPVQRLTAFTYVMTVH